MIDYPHIPTLHLARYYIIVVGKRHLKLMFTVNDALCTNQLEKAIKQHIKQWTNGYLIKIDLQELAYQKHVKGRLSKFENFPDCLDMINNLIFSLERMQLHTKKCCV